MIGSNEEKKSRDSTASELTCLLVELKANKPDNVHIEPDIIEFMNNGDALSQEFLIFQRGGSVGGKDAVPFVMLTPELLALLRYLYAD